MKNIAILSSTYLPELGGLQFQIYWLLLELDSKMDHYKKTYGIDNIYFIAPHLRGNEYAAFKHIKVLEISAGEGKAEKLKAAFQLTRHVQKENITLIHAFHGLLDALYANIAKFFTGCPYVVTSQGQDLAYDARLNYGGRLNKNMERIIAFNLKRAEYLTTISRDMCEFAYELIPEEKVILIPNTSPYGEIEQFEQSEIDQKIVELKRQHHIEEGQVVCLTLSGARTIKNHNNMIEGYAKAYAKNKNIRLLIAAHGERTPYLKEQVKTLGLEDAVGFIGFVTGIEKRAYFEMADIYPNTAFFEPFGLVYLEAVTHKVAVLGSRCGGGRDIFEHKKNAYLIDPDDVDEIAEGFLYLADEQKRQTIIDGTEGLLDKYTCANIWKLYFDVYEKVLLG